MKIVYDRTEALWKRAVRLSAPWALTVASLAFLVGFYGFAPFKTITYDSNFFCTPDARVQDSGDDTVLTNKWNPETALWITLAFGRFTYAQAKAIDVAWDLVVGFGGQALIAYWAYPIIRRTLAHDIQRWGVKTPLYASLAFDKVSLSGTWALIRHGSFNWFTMLLTFAYILAFPTLMSLVTGYQAGLIPYVQLSGGDLVLASQLATSQMVLVDGPRVGLPPMIAAQQGDAWNQTIFAYRKAHEKLASAIEDYFVDGNVASEVFSGRPREVATAACYDESKGAYDGARCSLKAVFRQSGFPRVDIDSNITLFNSSYELVSLPLDIALDGRLVGQYFLDFIMGTDNHFFSGGVTERYWSLGGAALNSSYLGVNNKCMPTKDYEWGFSYLMVFAASFLTLLFAVNLSVLSLCTALGSGTDKLEQSVSMYEDILVLASAIRSVVRHDEDAMTAAELEKKIKASKHSIKAEAVDHTSSSEEQVSLTAPVEEEKREALKMNVQVTRVNTV